MKSIDHQTSIHPILDFEASSLSDSSYPISVGLIVGKRRYYWIIKPKAEWVDWSLASQAIHGIKRSFLFEHGKDAEDVYLEMLGVLSEHDAVYSDNPYWEARWLAVLGEFPTVVRDVRELIPKIHHAHVKEVMHEQFRLYQLTPHKADHDALALSLTINYLNRNEEAD